MISKFLMNSKLSALENMLAREYVALRKLTERDQKDQRYHERRINSLNSTYRRLTGHNYNPVYVMQVIS